MNEHPRSDPNGSMSGDASDKPLKPKELQAAALLTVGMKQGDVASALGVSRTTIYRYEEKPGFAQARNR